MIKIKDLEKSYKGRCVLSVDSLNISKGETVLLAGANGSGKSTLLKIIADVVKSDKGQCIKNGSVLYLPQQSIGFDMSCFDNLLFGVKKTEENKEKALSLLKTAGLYELSNNNAKKLSGGEKQRLALCRVMMRSCDILLLDEPTSAVDTIGARLIENMIRDYKKENDCTVIISLHSPALAKSLGGRMLLLSKGSIIEDGNTEKVIKNPTSEQGKEFLSQWIIN